MSKKLFKIYNRLTHSSDIEYKFMVDNNSEYISRAKEIMKFLEMQDIDLRRLPDYNNSDEPDTGSSYFLFIDEATVYDPMGEDDVNKRKKEIYEKNYDRPDVYLIAKALQETEEKKSTKLVGVK
jgi:hypothetical protein